MPLSSGLQALENEALAVCMLAERGGKLSSFRDRRLDREWLLPSQLPDGAYPASAYGADFSLSDTSGFDECLPNVSAGPSPDGTIQWPDHGELWSRPWSVERDGASLLGTIHGEAQAYTLTRRCTLEGDTLRLDYALENRDTRPLDYLWSAHPLLQVTPGMRILLPEGVSKVFVNGASDPALGTFGEYRPWPRLGGELDFSTIQPREAGVAVKLFVPHMPEGHCTLWDPPSGHALHFSWDTAALPHLGLWLCYGGWPSDGRSGHLTVALEPCTGMPDALHRAAQLGCARTLAPAARTHWTLRLRSFLLQE